MSDHQPLFEQIDNYLITRQVAKEAREDARYIRDLETRLANEKARADTAKATLRAVAELPGKWRKSSSVVVWICADELQAALEKGHE